MRFRKLFPTQKIIEKNHLNTDPNTVMQPQFVDNQLLFID